MNRPTGCLLAIMLIFSLSSSALAQQKTENLILITLDGVRPQEIFGGLDLNILKAVTKKGAVQETPLYLKYWAATSEERRLKVMPFFWGTLMKQHGSIAGNRNLGSTVKVTNQHRFSYPGYAEILTGQAHDDVINSNDPKRNPYITVMEFLKRKLRLDVSQVAAFASWEIMDWIVEHEAGAITSNAGFEAYEHPDLKIRELGKLQFETVTPWNSVRHDIYTFRFAMAHLQTYQPRVLYLALGETDDWAHDGRYDRVLETLTRTDTYLQQLWEFLQRHENYQGKTTILMTTDHGRGMTAANWTDHGKKIEEAQYIWLAIISPDNDLRGEWKNVETIYQNQIAATLCRYLAFDYRENNRLAGLPIERLFPKTMGIGH